MVKVVSKEKTKPGLFQPADFTETEDSCQENLVKSKRGGVEITIWNGLHKKFVTNTAKSAK